jgi:hypothetical protein
LLNANFRDMLNALLDENVEFLIVGGYAVITHGYVRTTDDIDFWVRNSEENVDRLWRALKKFKAPLSKVTRADFLSDDLIYQIGTPPYRIDLIMSVTGVDFDTAWSRRIYKEIGDIRSPVIGREDLLAAKQAAGRPQDLADIARILGPPKKRRPSKKSARPQRGKKKKR